MIACSIGMMVPQKIVADVNISTSAGTVTVTADNAGDLAAYLNTATTAQLDELKAATIVFVGKFNSTDLSTLSSKGCCVATSVNMAEAKFISTTIPNTYLYHSDGDRTDKSEGDMCIVGSVKKQSAGVRAWQGIEESDIPSDQISNVTTVNELPSEVTQTHDVYYKIPTAYSYYKKVNGTWESVTDPTTIPDNATILTPYSYMTLTGLQNGEYSYWGDNGNYTRFATSFDYYTNPSTLMWKDADNDYNNGDQLGDNVWFASESEVEAPTSSGQTAYVGGVKYAFKNGSWSTDLSVEETYDYTQMKFSYWSNTITNAVTSNYAPDDYYVGKTNGTFSGCSKLESVTYNSGIVDGVENNADDIKKFTTVVIGSNVKQIATKAFFNIASITTLNTTAADNLTVIGNSAFMGCTSFSGDGTGEFHIPNSVQTIEESAFEACYGLVNLYFDADSHISSIQKKAFYMTNEGATHLKNVYVNVNPAREVPCAKETFNKTDCCNQTAVGTARLRLHYPPKYYDFYVGEYKSQYNGGGITQSYLNDAYAAATNGWQEIMSSGILMPDGVNWRTFSDEVPYRVPVSPADDHTVREIYLVHGYDAAKNAAILVRMKAGDIIPKNTGVIVHYTFNTSGGAALYLPPVLKDQRDSEGHLIARIVDPDADAMSEYDEALYPSDDKRYKPTGGTEYFKNYLKKLNKVTVYIDNVEIEDGKKTYRNFFFCNNDDLKNAEAKYKGNEWSADCLKGWGFLRAKHDNYTISNKAYLHFPATEGFPGSESVGVNTEEPNSTSSAKQFGFITIDENGFEFECAPVLPGIATAIKNAEAIVSDDSFYNMQGMKVENPSKGIYIKNGKKYVIK